MITNDTVKNNYFSEKYLCEKTDDLQLPNLHQMNKAFVSVDHHIRNGDIDLEVFNATRGGMLEVFPRVDIDEVIKELEEKSK